MLKRLLSRGWLKLKRLAPYLRREGRHVANLLLYMRMPDLQSFPCSLRPAKFVDNERPSVWNAWIGHYLLSTTVSCRLRIVVDK